MNIAGKLLSFDYKEPINTKFGPCRYSYGKMLMDDGNEREVMFVNRDMTAYVGSDIAIRDDSQQGNGVQMVAGKNYTYKVGGGKAVTVSGGGVAATPATPATPARAAAPSRASASLESMEELIDYGLECAAMADAKWRNKTVRATPGALLDSVFRSAMYGFKEGRPLHKEKPLEQAAAEVFDAVPAGVEEDDDIPF